MAPLPILRSSVLGDGAGNPICTLVSANLAVNASETDTRCAGYSDDYSDYGDPTIDADHRVVAAGRSERLRQDPVGRTECWRVFPAAFCRPSRMVDQSASPVRAHKP